VKQGNPHFYRWPRESSTQTRKSKAAMPHRIPLARPTGPLLPFLQRFLRFPKMDMMGPRHPVGSLSLLGLLVVLFVPWATARHSHELTGSGSFSCAFAPLCSRQSQHLQNDLVMCQKMCSRHNKTAVESWLSCCPS
jgi:hypothetical protein